VAFSIRRIEPHDWRLLRELRLGSLADSPHAFGTRFDEASGYVDSDWMATARAAAAGNSRAWFFAFDGAGEPAIRARAVGLVQARRRPPGDCLLFSMWVAPRARRAGAGRLLVDAVATWGAGWGAERIILWVVASNATARGFYERIGFRLMDEGADARSGAAHGAFAMQRPIS
jgi:GNAT superfamily N-acetyltransferase